MLYVSTAWAEEPQLTLSVDVGYSQLLAKSALPSQGAVVGVAGALALDDMWTLQARIGYALHPGDSPLQLISGSGEVLYIVDVFSIAPFIGAGLDAFLFEQNARYRTEGAAHAVLGFNHNAGRGFVVGIDIRPFVFFTSLKTEPVYITVTGRCGITFDL